MSLWLMVIRPPASLDEVLQMEAEGSAQDLT